MCLGVKWWTIGWNKVLNIPAPEAITVLWNVIILFLNAKRTFARAEKLESIVQSFVDVVGFKDIAEVVKNDDDTEHGND